MDVATDDAKLKRMVKEALVEVLDERREDFQQFVAEALEDVAMTRAIQEGEHTPLVDREDILRLLEDGT